MADQRTSPTAPGGVTVLLLFAALAVLFVAVTAGGREPSLRPVIGDPLPPSLTDDPIAVLETAPAVANECAPPGGQRLEALASAEAPVPLIALHASGWRIVDLERVACGSGIELRAVAAAHPDTIAVGSIGHEERRVATVWTSRDGVTWTRVPHQPAFEIPDRDLRLRDVAPGGPGVVAVGHSCSIPGSAECRAEILVSDDQQTWQRLDLAQWTFRPGTRLVGIETVGDALVAWGQAPEGGVAWASLDGYTWTRVVTAGRLGSVTGVTGDADSVVVWGTTAPTLGGIFDLVWVGPHPWSLEPMEADPDEFHGGVGPLIRDMISNENGTVAVGHARESGRGAIWWSADGRDWERISTSVQPGSYDRIVATAQGFVAWQVRGIVATSRDGLVWHEWSAADLGGARGFDRDAITDLVRTRGGIAAIAPFHDVIWTWSSGRQ